MQPVIVHAQGDDPPKSILYYGQDCRESLRQLPSQSVHMVTTSPPYWGLRDYLNDLTIWGGDKDCDHMWGDTIPGSNKGGSGTPTDKNNRGENYGRGEPRGKYCTSCQAWFGQLGLEPTPEMFVEHIVEIFREVKRVLRDDGTLWLNLGDSYAGSGKGRLSDGSHSGGGIQPTNQGTMVGVLSKTPTIVNCKSKDLVGIPWMVALALRADGWYLRSDIIWSKVNPMPESVTDRPTRSHEYIFLLAKNNRYFYDNDAIKEPCVGSFNGGLKAQDTGHQNYTGHRGEILGVTRNKRSVWNVNPKPYLGAHFATWPEELVEPMILAGTGAEGCCPTCGTSYTRIVEKPIMPIIDPSSLDRFGNGNAGIHRKIGGQYQAWRDANPNQTVGLEPCCSCPTNVPPVRCVVLDPFSGSATTGKVANDHGRDYIGLDANESYLDMAIARLQNRAAPQKTDIIEESSIMDLFGV